MVESYSKDKCDYLINHVAFPIKLPQTSPNDSDQDFWSLELINHVLSETSHTLEIQNISNIFQTWAKIQTNRLDGDKIHSKMSTTISNNSVFPLFLPKQNVCLIISMSSPSAIISYFQVSFANETLMSRSCSDIDGVVYPTASFGVQDLEMLGSLDFAYLLADLANKPHVDSCAKSTKAGHTHEEVREVPDSRLLTDWLTYALIGNKSYVDNELKIRKKIRDEVNYFSTLIPFRRSGIN
jgi:hypothetical protein